MEIPKNMSRDSASLLPTMVARTYSSINRHFIVEDFALSLKERRLSTKCPVRTMGGRRPSMLLVLEASTAK